MKLSRILPLVGGAALAALAVGFEKPAQALTFNVYTSEAAFQAAVGPTQVEDFQSYAPQTFASGVPYSFTGFDFTSTPGTAPGSTAGIVPAGGAGSPNGSAYLGWGASGSGGGPSSIFTFAGPQAAFGFQYRNTDPTDSYNLTIAGSSFPNVLTFSSTGFIGVVATDGFFSVADLAYGASGGINDPAGIDNVYTATTAVGSVPFDIPGGATIPAIGSLLALGAMRKARKSLASKAIAN